MKIVRQQPARRHVQDTAALRAACSATGANKENPHGEQQGQRGGSNSPRKRFSASSIATTSMTWIPLVAAFAGAKGSSQTLGSLACTNIWIAAGPES